MRILHIVQGVVLRCFRRSLGCCFTISASHWHHRSTIQENVRSSHQSLTKVWQQKRITEGLVQTLDQSLACSIGSCATTVHSAARGALKTDFCSRVWLLLLHSCADTSFEAQSPCLLVDNGIMPLMLARLLLLSGTTCNEGSWGVVAPVLAHIYCSARA